MRIAIFTETYLPYINGVVTHISVLKKGLEGLGHEVLIVTADPHTRRHYIEDGVLHCPAKTSQRIYGYGLASPLSQKRLRMIADFEPDIIHVQQEFGVGISGIMIAKMLHVPIIYTMHTMYDDYIYYIAPRKLVPLVKKISHGYARIIAHSASAITGPSAKIQDYFKSVGIKKHITVIPNTVDVDFFDPAKVSDEQRAVLREKYGIDANKMVACFVGRLGKEKSVDVLLEYWAKSFKADDNVHLLIIGGGPDRDELEAQVDSLGIRSMVTFTGPILHDEIPQYYAISDLFVTASLTEVYSISMLESMAAGLPVLQRYDEQNSYQIINGVNGFIYRDRAEFEDIMRILRAKTPAEFAELKETVMDSVRKSGAESLANCLLKIYNEYNRRTRKGRKKLLRTSKED